MVDTPCSVRTRPGPPPAPAPAPRRQGQVWWWVSLTRPTPAMIEPGRGEGGETRKTGIVEAWKQTKRVPTWRLGRRPESAGHHEKCQVVWAMRCIGVGSEMQPIHPHHLNTTQYTSPREASELFAIVAIQFPSPISGGGLAARFGGTEYWGKGNGSTWAQFHPGRPGPVGTEWLASGGHMMPLAFSSPS